MEPASSRTMLSSVAYSRSLRVRSATSEKEGRLREGKYDKKSADKAAGRSKTM